MRIGAVVNASTTNAYYDEYVAPMYDSLAELNTSTGGLLFGRDARFTTLDMLHAAVVDLDARLSKLEDTDVNEWLIAAQAARVQLKTFTTKVRTAKWLQWGMLGALGVGAVGGAGALWFRKTRKRKPFLLAGGVGAGSALALYTAHSVFTNS